MSHDGFLICWMETATAAQDAASRTLRYPHYVSPWHFFGNPAHLRDNLHATEYLDKKF
jgi:hypothetical protein